MKSEFLTSDHGPRVQLSDGSFWPDVKLQIGDDPKGPWETIPQSEAESERKRQ